MKKLSAIGNMGLLCYMTALHSAIDAKATVSILADYYRTPELLKLKKMYGRDLKEIERIGEKMGLIKMRRLRR